MLPYSPYRRHAGFSLVEIMVGIAVGMLGIVVMMQMYSVFENQKRATTSGDDAQNSGAIILHRLQRDIRHSGYGISELDLLGCNVLLRTGITLNAIAPVTINHASIPAGDANSDTLLVVYGNSNGSIQGEAISSGSGTEYTMTNAATTLANDRVIAEPLSLIGILPRPACGLALGSVVSSAAATVTMAASSGVTDGTLYNLGQAPQILAYAIRSGNLTVCDYMVNNCGLAGNASDVKVWVPIASDIVSMRAQYGRDTVTPTPALQLSYIVNTYDQTTPTTNCLWARTPAVRIALVARGAAGGVQAITTAPTWAGSAGAPINLSANANWQRHHYKVFETTVPIRNVAWMGVQAGC